MTEETAAFKLFYNGGQALFGFFTEPQIRL